MGDIKTPFLAGCLAPQPGPVWWAIQAADIVSERGDAGVDRVKELTDGIGADSVLECVGTKEPMAQVIQRARPGTMMAMLAGRAASNSTANGGSPRKPAC